MVGVADAEILNPSFEIGDTPVANWTYTESASGWEGLRSSDAVGSFPTHGSYYFVFHGLDTPGTGSYANLTQKINFSEIENGTITFDLRSWADRQDYEFRIYINDSDLIYSKVQDGTWELLNETINVSEYEGELNLTFQAYQVTENDPNADCYWYIDNIREGGTPLPPPPPEFIEINEGIGSIMAYNSTEATIRQFTPDRLNITINPNESISGFTLYIENTDPDLVKAYGEGLTQTRYANNTIKLVFDLTANISKTINLSRIWYPTRWSFIITGDTRPGHDNNSDNVSDQFVEVANEASEVNPIYPIINVGDIIGGGGSITDTPVCTEEMHEAYWNVQQNKGIWLGVVGNHDQARDGNPQGSAQEIFDKYWGSSNYSYSFGDWYFIAINSYADDGSAPSESNINGFISDSQWSWIQDEVNNHKNDYNLISFFHHPLWRYAGGASGTTGDWQDSGDCTNLRDLFINSGTKLIMVGHDHFHHESTQSGGLIQLVEGRGGADLHEGETLWGFSVVELNSTDVVEITRVDVTDGGSITTTYNNSNDYSQLVLKATINNTHPTGIPCMLKFRMSGANSTAYQVTGADYYDIIKNDYGYVVIAQATANSVKEVTVSAEGGAEGCTAPTISDLTNTTPGVSNVTITWTTNQTTNNRVKYSKNSDMSDYYWSSWCNNTDSITITLTGLNSNTVYYYQAYSENATNNSCYTYEPASSPYKNFTTAFGYDASNPYSCSVLWYVPEDTSFSVTFAGSETQLNFTANNRTASLIEPNGQNATSNKPVITIKNEGTGALDFSCNLTTKPSWAVFKINNVSDYGTATELNTEAVIINTTVPVGGTTDIYLWLNITNATAGLTSGGFRINSQLS